MIKAGLEKLFELAIKATNVQILEVRGEPNHLYGVLNRNTGDIDWREKQPETRTHELFRLPDFVAAVKAYRVERRVLDDEADDSALLVKRDEAARPSVFCGRGSVRATLDEPYPRREAVSLRLKWSPEYKFLDPDTAGQQEKHVSNKWDHKAFVDMLRTDLGQAIDPADLLKFRSLRVTTGGETGSKQEQGREALSKSVQREMFADGKDVPDELAVSLFVYQDLVEPAGELRKTVRLAVSVDLQTGTFRLSPICGELETAQRETDAWVRDYLEKELGYLARVFCGAV